MEPLVQRMLPLLGKAIKSCFEQNYSEYVGEGRYSVKHITAADYKDLKQVPAANIVNERPFAYARWASLAYPTKHNSTLSGLAFFRETGMRLYESFPEVTQMLVCKWGFEQRYKKLAEQRTDRELRKAAVKQKMEEAAEAEKVKQANKAQEVVTYYNIRPRWRQR